jgi:hypothetical protein
MGIGGMSQGRRRVIYCESERNDPASLRVDVQPPLVVADYNGLLAALRWRIIDLYTSCDAVEGLAGLPDRYCAKVLAGVKRCGPISVSAVVGAA